MIDSLTIKIYPASDEGYMYDIYDNEDGDGDAIDGGQCTTTLQNALDMAHEQAHAIIARE